MNKPTYAFDIDGHTIVTCPDIPPTCQHCGGSCSPTERRICLSELDDFAKQGES